MSGPEDRAAWLELIVASMLATWKAIARSSGADMLERDGVVALRNRRVPERSVFNSVGYTDAGALLHLRAELAAFYEETGSAWTVWVPEADGEVIEALAEAGHVLDAAPRAMGRRLEGLERPRMDDVEWTADGDMEVACILNDHAYGLPEGTWIKGNGERPEGYRTYLATLDGRPAATVATVLQGEDCEVWSVATEPEARGRGLATALMRQALWDAKEEGCATTTLQGTKLGRPVYDRVGYEDFGALQMWEKRPPALAAHASRRPPA
jgi:GNAT superfamily N-acetyltransferase